MSSWMSGINTTSRMRNGIERIAFTTNPTISLTAWFGVNSLCCVR